jgi:hypothetical protein
MLGNIIRQVWFVSTMQAGRMAGMAVENTGPDLSQFKNRSI